MISNSNNIIYFLDITTTLFIQVMSSTVDRWFVPDEEYYRFVEDYAIVHHSAKSICNDIDECDGDPARFTNANDTFMSEYRHNGADFVQCYEFAIQGQLVYADVDDEDLAHKEKFYGEWAREIPIEKNEKTTEKTKKVMEDLMKACADEWFSEEDFPHGDEDNDVMSKRKAWALHDLHALVRRGLLEAPIVTQILTAKTTQDKEDILNFMSGQNRRPTKRPVLVLLHMVDSRQTTEVGETTGWVIGYDFIKELLVIKPFVAKGGNHPLGGKWHGDVAQDGVSFSGTPREFAKLYAELGKTVDAGIKEDGFKLLVHTLAAGWIGKSGTALETAYGADFQADLAAIKEAMTNVKKAMKEIKFPAVEKEKKHAWVVGPFYRMLSVMKFEEDMVRDAAVIAKEQGDDKVAQNAAKLYERIYKQITAFNKNPSMDLDI